MKRFSRLFVFISTILLTATAVADNSSNSQPEETSFLKIDVGPVYMHVDFIHSDETEASEDMAGVKGDINMRVYKGIVVHPSVIYGKNSQTSVLGACLTVGQLIPINKKLIIMPSVGWNYSRTKKPTFLPGFPEDEDFYGIYKSNGPLVGLDVYIDFAKGWRICGSVQYIWSQTELKVTSSESIPFYFKDRSKGPNWSLMIEKDISESWSINLGVGYNVSLSKELHGIRAGGVKLGLAKWF